MEPGALYEAPFTGLHAGGPAIALQVLVYPVTDCDIEFPGEPASHDDAIMIGFQVFNSPGLHFCPQAEKFVFFQNVNAKDIAT